MCILHMLLHRDEIGTEKITITPYLKKKYKTGNFGIINIRITQNRKLKYLSLKIKIKERY